MTQPRSLPKTGSIIGGVGIIEDTTERRQAEDALRDSEQRYWQMFERNRAIKVLIDPVERWIVDANPAACDFYGYSIDKLKQLKVDDISTMTLEQLLEEIATIRSERSRRFLSKRTATGQLRDVEVHTSLIDVQGRHLLYSIVHDITDRRKAEEALKTSEEMYRRIFENIEDVYYEVEWIPPFSGKSFGIQDSPVHHGKTSSGLPLRIYGPFPNRVAATWRAD